MRFPILFLTQSVLHAFNENLTAVHYSIVNAGIDEEIRAGKVGFSQAAWQFTSIIQTLSKIHSMTYRRWKFTLIIDLFAKWRFDDNKPFLGHLDWRCDGCTIVCDEDSVIVNNRFAEPTDFEISTDIKILESQNVRITIELVDYVADLVQVWFLNEIQVNA